MYTTLSSCLHSVTIACWTTHLHYCQVGYEVSYSCVHCNPPQDQYRARIGFSLCSQFSQGKACFPYTEPLFSLQGSCIHYKDFPVRITTQGDPCSHYREWFCSVQNQLKSVHFQKTIAQSSFLSKVLSFSLKSKQSQQKWQHSWKRWGLRNCLLKMNEL